MKNKKSTPKHIHISPYPSQPLKTSNAHFFIANALPVFFIVLGCILTMRDNISNLFNFDLGPALFIGITVFTLLFTFIYSLKKHQTIAFLSLLAVSVFYVYSTIEKIVTSLFVINANLAQQLNTMLKLGITDSDVHFLDKEEATTFLLLYIAFFLALIVGMLVVNSKNLTFTFILIFIFAFIEVAFVPMPSLLVFFLLVSGFFMTYTLKCVSFKTKRFKLFKQKSVHVLQSESIKKSTLPYSLYSVLAVVLTLFIVIGFVYPEHEYDPNSKTRLATAKLMDKIINLNFDKSTGPKKAQGGLSGGKKLGDISTLSYSNQIHLKVKSDIKAAVYLRGYAGGYYQDNAWHDKFDNTAFEKYDADSFSFNDLYTPFNSDRDMFEYIQDEYQQRYQDYSFMPKLWNSITSGTIEIENVKAVDSFLYTPYFFKNPIDIKDLYRDLYIFSGSNGKQYSFDSYYFSPDFEDEDTPRRYTGVIDTYLASNYLNIRNYSNSELYYAYVKEEYTKLPREGLEKIRELAEEIKDNGNGALEYIELTKMMVQSKTEYSLNPGATPKDKDFAEYFLFENNKGFCMHYATAGALILKACGVPARYVEGYIVTEDDFANAKAKGLDYAEIRDTNAHAWVEVYIRPLGWIPVEMTSGCSTSGVNDNNFDNIDENPTSSTISKPSSAPSSNSNPSSVLSSSSSSQPSSVVKKQQTKITKHERSVFLFGLIIVVVLSLMFIITRRIVIIKRRKTLFNSQSNKTALMLYEYTKQQLAFIGYKSSQYSNETAFAIDVEQKCSLIKDEEFQKIVEVALRARFSPHQIQTDDFNVIKDFAYSLNKEIYLSLKFFDKLKYKFLKALI